MTEPGAGDRPTDDTAGADAADHTDPDSGSDTGESSHDHGYGDMPEAQGRRRVLKFLGGGFVVGGLGLAGVVSQLVGVNPFALLTGDDGAAEAAPVAIDDFLTGARGYDGSIAVRTGAETVTVAVGAGEEGVAFDPPAVRVEAGTTVVWEWTGEGGTHNVAATDGSEAAFESELAGEPGHTFEQTFEAPGVATYVCMPHETLGMKGAVDVVE